MRQIQLGGYYKKCPIIKGYALVDDEDFEWLNQWKWHLLNCREKKYAIKTGGKTMHRLIMQTPKGMETDHINGNGLDNRRSNLRICANFQNQMNRKIGKNNTSGFKGVYWDKKNNEWYSSIMFNYKSYYLGRFNERIEAAKAYNQKAIELFGGFARLNKI